MDDLPRWTRRGLLATGLAAATAACSSGGGQTTTSSPAGAATGHASTGSSHPLAIAHRGGGGDWPEMTLYAYQQAVQVAGLSGMEVSVHRSADGVLVCNHDDTTADLGSKALTIATSTWSELSSVMVSARATTDPSQPARPLTRLDELLEWWPRTMPLWIEPKTKDAVAPLQATLVGLSSPPPIVWKQPINATHFEFATQHGWRTWGYVLNGAQQVGYANTLASNRFIDMIGAWTMSSDAEVHQVVQAANRAQKRAVMWQINTPADRQRALSLGCSGLMVSRVKELLTTT